MRKIKYIINPAAGKGDAKQVIENIHKEMKRTNIEYTITISAYENHVEKISKKAVEEGHTDIVAVGGDGTVLEAFNGLFGKNVNLGIIPSGTGNDLVKMLNITKNVDESIKKIIRGKTRKIDIGKVNGRYFLNVVGIGIDGEIVEETKRVKKILSGSPAYIYSTFSTLIKYRAKNMIINIDGVVFKRNALLVAIGNGKYCGGGMMLTPGAEIDNEEFQIVVIKKISKLKFALLFRKVFSGTHINENCVEVYQGKKIKISSAEDVKINADGNIIGNAPAEIELLAKAQNIIC